MVQFEGNLATNQSIFRIVVFTLLPVFQWRIYACTPCDEQATGENMRAFCSLKQLYCNSSKQNLQLHFI